MTSIHKLNDLLLRIELDIQKARDSAIYDADLQGVKNRLQSVIINSKNIAEYIEVHDKEMHES